MFCKTIKKKTKKKTTYFDKIELNERPLTYFSHSLDGFNIYLYGVILLPELTMYVNVGQQDVHILLRLNYLL